MASLLTKSSGCGQPTLSSEGKSKHFSLLMLLCTWLVVIGLGLTGLWAYSATAAQVETASTRLPEVGGIWTGIHVRTLVMFIHPQCACSRASLAELEELMVQATDKFEARVILVLPTGAPGDWSHSRNASLAASIAGVTVSTDVSGLLAKTFHATTSGETFVYDADGQLEFHGGITGVRGHVGQNPGRTAIEQLMLTGHPGKASTPVFGCGLFNNRCDRTNETCPR